MEDEIQSAETTAAVEETNTAQEAEVTTSQSGEDTNAQVGTETDTEAAEESKVKQLIEQRSGYKTKWEQRADQISEQAQVLAQSQAQGVDVLSQYGMTATDLQLMQLQEDRKWDKAYMKHPELKEDPDLDNLVYERYVARRDAGERVSPEDVAKETLDYLTKKTKQIESSAYTKAEDDISRKIANSSSGIRRSETTRNSGPSVAELRTRARQGDRDALDALYELI